METNISVLLPELALLWAESLGDANISIAILDGTVDISHPEFIGANLTILDNIVNDTSSAVASEHGTHVSSIIFGQYNGLIKGIAPLCRGIIIPIFTQTETGDLTACSQLDLARAITLAVQQGAHIINISGGQLDPTGEVEPLLANAIRLCADNGVLIVAATGNDGCQCLHIPAAVAPVLAVGAMDKQGMPLAFSNWDERYGKTGVLAPGAEIWGALPGGKFGARNGTSYATPIVSGIVALLLSIQLKMGKTPNPYAIRAAILDNVIGCDEGVISNCQRLLAGRLNIVGALTQVKEGDSIKMSEQQLISSENHNHDKQMLTADIPSVSEPITTSPATKTVTASAYTQVTPSGGPGCGCGGNASPALVYALGEIGYDFVTEARRDSFLQHSGNNLLDPIQLLNYLQENPSAATSIIWTLNVDNTPVYAIQPGGAFANVAYERLREALQAQLTEGVDLVSLPGYASGSITLLSGYTVPILVPEIRGIYTWTVPHLIKAVLGDAPEGEAEQKAHKANSEGIINFLERVYYELRNLGIAPQERAMNYAATNAFQLEYIYQEAIKAELKLDTIDVERSPICRPGSDCWDVKLTFFNPTKRMEHARKVYRFTIDISDVVPLTVGKVRHWHVY